MAKPRDIPAAASIVGVCLEAADGDPLRALGLAIRATRWQLIAAGKLKPLPGERLPDELWLLLQEHAA